MSNPNMNLKMNIPAWSSFSAEEKSFINAFMKNARFKFVSYDDKIACSLQSATEIECVKFCDCNEECNCDNNTTVKYAINAVYTTEKENFPIIYISEADSYNTFEIPNFITKFISSSSKFKFCIYYTKIAASEEEIYSHINSAYYSDSIAEDYGSTLPMSINRIDAVDLPLSENDTTVQIKSIYTDSGTENTDTSILLSTLPLDCNIQYNNNRKISLDYNTDRFKITKSHLDEYGETVITDNAYYKVSICSLKNKCIQIVNKVDEYNNGEELVDYEYESPELTEYDNSDIDVRYIGLFIGRMLSDNSGRIVFNIAMSDSSQCSGDSQFKVNHLYKVSNDTESIPKEVILPIEDNASRIIGFASMHLVCDSDLSLDDNEYFKVYRNYDGSDVEMLIDDMSNVDNLLKITIA